MLFQAKKTQKMAYDTIKWHPVTLLTQKFFDNVAKNCDDYPM